MPENDGRVRLVGALAGIGSGRFLYLIIEVQFHRAHIPSRTRFNEGQAPLSSAMIQFLTC